MGKGKSDYATISIPRPLYERLKKALQGTGYRSVTEFVVTTLRRAVADLESDDVKRKLRALGYC